MNLGQAICIFGGLAAMFLITVAISYERGYSAAEDRYFEQESQLRQSTVAAQDSLTYWRGRCK